MVCAATMLAKHWVRHTHGWGGCECQLTIELVTVGWGAEEAEEVEGTGACSSS